MVLNKIIDSSITMRLNSKGTASNILNVIVDLENGLSGYKVSRLDHSLQSATRAWFDSADIDWVKSTLLHITLMNMMLE